MASLQELLRSIGSGQMPNSGLVASRIPQAGRQFLSGPPEPTPPSDYGPMWAVERANERGASAGYSSSSMGDSGGAWSGLTGLAFGGLKAVGEGLKAVDTGRRFVLSSLQEGLDAAGITDGDASWSDWKSQIADPSFGFGDITGDLTGNKWVDRAIGFAGDVVFDPLSYVTGGATQFAGKANRFSLAGRAAALKGTAGLTDDAIEKLVAKVSTRGAGALDDVERKLLGVGESGLRFGNPLGGAGTVRVPGTGGLDRAIGRTLSKGRNAVTSGKTWKAVSGRRVPEGMNEVYDVLRTGVRSDGGLTPTAAALSYDYMNGLKAAKGMYTEAWGSTATKVLEGMDADARVALTHATEAGDSNELSALFGRVLESLKQSGVDIGDITKLDDIAGYMPHMWSADGQRLVFGVNAQDPAMVSLRRQLKIDLTKPESMTLKRAIRPGTKITVGTGDAKRTVEFATASIREINEKLSEAFPEYGVVKWLEDDAATLTAGYIDQAAKSAAKAESLIRLLDVAPDQIVSRLEHMSTEALDTAATATVNREMKETIQGIIAQRDADNAAIVQRLVDQSEQMRGPLVASVEARLRALGEIGQKAADRVAAAKSRNTSLGVAAKEVKAVAKQQKARVKTLRNKAIAEFNKLDEAYSALRLQRDTVGSGVELPKFVQEIFEGRQLDRATAVKELERLTNERAAQVAKLDQADAALDEITGVLQFAEYSAERLRNVLNDPEEMRRLVEEGNVDLFQEFVEEGGFTKVVDLSDANPDYLRLQRAQKKLDTALGQVDEAVQGQVDRAAVHVQDASESVRKWRQAMKNAERRVRKYGTANAWAVRNRKFKATQDATYESAVAKQLRWLTEQFDFLGGESTNFVTRPVEFEELRSVWKQAQKNLAETQQQNLLRRELRAIDDAGALAERQLPDAEANVAATKELLSTETAALARKRNPDKIEAQKAVMEYIEKTLADEEAEVSRILETVKAVPGQKKKAMSNAERRMQGSLRRMEILDATEELLMELIEGTEKNFEDLVNGWKDRLGLPLEVLTSTEGRTRKVVVQLADGSADAGSILLQPPSKARVVPQFEMNAQALGNIKRDLEARLADEVEAAWDAVKPMTREEKLSWKAASDYWKARKEYDVAVANHRRADRTYKGLIGRQNSGGLRADYLAPAQTALLLAERKWRGTNFRVSKVERELGQRVQQTILDGADRLPYESEVMQRTSDAVESATAYPLKQQPDVARAIVDPFSVNGLPTTISERAGWSPGTSSAKRLRVSVESEQEISDAVAAMSDSELERVVDGLAPEEVGADEIIEVVGDERQPAVGMTQADYRRRMKEDPEFAAEMRARAAQTKEALKKLRTSMFSGDITPGEAYQLVLDDDYYKEIKLVDFLASLPGQSKIRAIRVQSAAAVTMKRRVRAAGEDVVQDLVSKMTSGSAAVRNNQSVVGDNLGTMLEWLKQGDVVPPEVMDRLTQIYESLQGIDLQGLREEAAFRRVKDFIGKTNEEISTLDRTIADYETRLATAVRNNKAPDIELYEKLIPERQAELASLKQDLKQSEGDLAVLVTQTDRRSVGRTERNNLIDEASELIDFAVRYDAAVKAGGKPGDSLAAAVVDDILQREHTRLAGIAKQGASVLNRKDDERLAFDAFMQQVMDHLEIMDPAYRKSNMLGDQLKKMRKEAGLPDTEIEQLVFIEEFAPELEFVADGKVNDLADLSSLLASNQSTTAVSDIRATVNDMYAGESLLDFGDMFKGSGFNINAADSELEVLAREAANDRRGYEKEFRDMLYSVWGIGRGLDRQGTAVHRKLLKAVRKALKDKEDPQLAVENVLRKFWQAQDGNGRRLIDERVVRRHSGGRQSVARELKAIEDLMDGLGRRRLSTSTNNAKDKFDAVAKELADIDEAVKKLPKAEVNRARREVDRVLKAERDAAEKRAKSRGASKEAAKEARSNVPVVAPPGSDEVVELIYKQRQLSFQYLVAKQRLDTAEVKRGAIEGLRGRRANLIEGTKAEISVDWRHVLGVADEDYVSPITKVGDLLDVAHAYRAVRERETAKLEFLQETINEIKGSAAVEMSPEQSARVALGLEAAPESRMSISGQAVAARDDAQAVLSSIDQGMQDSQAKIAELGGSTENDFYTSIIDREVARDQAVLRQADEVSGIVDEMTALEPQIENAYSTFEQLDAAMGRLPQAEAADLAKITRSKRLNDLLQKQNNFLQREKNAGVSEVQAALKKLEGREFTAKDADGLVADYKELLKFVDVDTPEGQVAATLYRDFLDGVSELKTNQQSRDLMQAFLKSAKDGTFTEVYKRVANEGFVAMGEVLGKDNMIAVSAPLARVIKNVEKSIDSGAFLEAVELANRFFKTYATLSVGFHVRNWMGAQFMNFSEGVAMGNTRKAYNLVGRFKENPEEFVRSLRLAAGSGNENAMKELHALEAAFGSGASGRLDFGEIGKANARSKLVRDVMNTKTADALLGNWAVRKSQSIGTNLVEMPVRVALALDSLDRGMTMAQAISRIKRVHFDYSDLSKFDRKMKALIPFWVFMSRNLPLQMEQMLLKPRAYLMFNSLMRNFGAPNQDMLQWQKERNGFVLFNDSTMFGDKPQNIALMLDLQHNSLTDDMQKLDPRNPLRFLSQANPLLRVPAELIVDKKFYSDQPFYDQNRAEYAALQTVPPAAQLARLLAVGPYQERSQLQSVMNYAGVPLWGVDEEQMRKEMARRAG